MTQVYSSALIQLFKGPLLQRDHAARWAELLTHLADIRSYVAVLGLELYLDQADGYAFLRQQRSEEQDETLPKLGRRLSYSYWETVLAVILRRRLHELDASGDQVRLVLNQDELLQSLQTFWPADADEARLRKDCLTAIEHFEKKHRLLRRLPNGELEVERLLRALFDAQNLSELEERLKHGTDEPV